MGRDCSMLTSAALRSTSSSLILDVVSSAAETWVAGLRGEGETGGVRRVSEGRASALGEGWPGVVVSGWDGQPAGLTPL